MIRRLGEWLNPENIPQVNISGPSFAEDILKRAPSYLALLVVVHVLAFFILFYGARLQKRLVVMIPGLPEKRKRSANPILRFAAVFGQLG